MAIEPQSTNLCWLPPEPSTTSSHKGTKQLQAHSKQPPCAGEHKSPALHETTKARNSCKRAAGNQHVQHVLTHTRAQRFIKPYRLQAHSNNPTGTHHMAVHRNPALQARDSCKHTPSDQHALAHTWARHYIKPQRQDTVASTPRATNMCWPAHQSPALHQATIARTRYKYTANNQHVLAHTRAQHHIKPQRR